MISSPSDVPQFDALLAELDALTALEFESAERVEALVANLTD